MSTKPKYLGQPVEEHYQFAASAPKTRRGGGKKDGSKDKDGEADDQPGSPDTPQPDIDPDKS